MQDCRNFMVMLHLHVLRHAKTNQLSPTGLDYDRPLLPRGNAQADELADYFSNSGIRIDEVWVSTAKRTMQTFRRVKDRLNYDRFVEIPELYLAEQSELLNRIWKCHHRESLLIVGHNYGISELVSYLLDDAIELRTAEYIHLSMDVDEWTMASKGLATIEQRFRPSA